MLRHAKSHLSNPPQPAVTSHSCCVPSRGVITTDREVILHQLHCAAQFLLKWTFHLMWNVKKSSNTTWVGSGNWNGRGNRLTVTLVSHPHYSHGASLRVRGCWCHCLVATSRNSSAKFQPWQFSINTHRKSPHEMSAWWTKQSWLTCSQRSPAAAVTGFSNEPPCDLSLTFVLR